MPVLRSSLLRRMDKSVGLHNTIQSSKRIVTNGVYAVRVIAKDIAQNFCSFHERVNVNNEAGGTKYLDSFLNR